MPLPNLQFLSKELPPDLARHVLHREAALWVGEGFDNGADAAADIAKLATLPWQVVLLESTRGEMAKMIDAAASAVDRYARIRGFVHVIAENPAELIRSPKSLPVFLLNGRSDAKDGAASSSLPAQKSLLRRLTMIEELQKLRPRVLVVVARCPSKSFDDVLEAWGTDGFSPRLVVIDPFDQCKQAIDSWLAKIKAPAAVDRCEISVRDAVDSLTAKIDSILPDDRLLVQILRTPSRSAEVDVSDCEPIEFPLSDRFDFILSRHLAPVMADDLTDEQINQFFEGESPETMSSGNYWAAFAAGVPRGGRSDTVEVTLRALENCAKTDSDSNRFVILRSEPGAGGTTESRLTAFAAARAGYPVLLAKDKQFNVSASEVATFLKRVAEKTNNLAPVAEAEETPWLIVFDVSHWQGRESEAVRFLRELTRAGRSVVILCVVQDIADAFRLGRGMVDVTDVIRHDISEDEAVALGRHFNRFLVPRRRGVSESDWVTFWSRHSPMGGGSASFWVALSFWLRNQLDFNETIQGWLSRQLRSAKVPDEAWPIVLEVAALGIERQGAPEGILPRPAENRLAGDILEEVKSAVPSLALHYAKNGERNWYIAHDLLGRLFLNIVFYDREALNRYDLGQAQDTTHLRVLLLRRIAANPALERKIYQPLATEFPVNILKLDNGRLEFARYWQEVLAALDGMPPAFRNTSRTYKHHAAITRRRICTIREYFDISDEQRGTLLQEAVQLLEDALALPQTQLDEESDLNIYNSLSLAYQGLSEVEHRLGADEARLDRLWKKATEAAQNAKRLNPRNSYVLETLARNLIQLAHRHAEGRTERAVEALAYVYEAMSLEEAIDRQHNLLKFAQEAIELLREPRARDQAQQLASAGNPFGNLALAWIELVGTSEVLDVTDLSAFPKAQILKALDHLPTNESNPLVLQLRYALTVANEPWAFAKQLQILDALQVNLSHVPLQLRLERAILLHQEERHQEANDLFNEIRRINWDPANQEFVVVPARLEWLLARTSGSAKPKKRVCNAKAISRATEYRKFAKVDELQQVDVPYNPREFSVVFAPGNRFKCFITFGHNGPLIKHAFGEEGRQ